MEKIKDELTKLWSYYIQKNGFPYISKKYGVDVKETLMGMHSGEHYPTKSLDDLTAKEGTLENHEKKYHQSVQQPNYKIPGGMHKPQLKDIIKQLLETFNRIRKGRIHKNE